MCTCGKLPPALLSDITSSDATDCEGLASVADAAMDWRRVLTAMVDRSRVQLDVASVRVTTSQVRSQIAQVGKSPLK